MNGPGEAGSRSLALTGDGGRADTAAALLQAFLVPELQVACPSPAALPAGNLRWSLD